MIYELRTYVTEPNRIGELHERFAGRTLDIFERLGIEVVAFFTDRDNPDRLVYLTRFENEDKRQQGWKAFANDPEWLAVKQESERNGPLVADRHQVLLDPTEYSPLR